MVRWNRRFRRARGPLSHRASRPAAAGRQAGIRQVPGHPGTAKEAVRQRQERADMRRRRPVVRLAATGWPASPGETAALADAEPAAPAAGEFRLCPIDERDPRRPPSRAKKALAFFGIPRARQRIASSRRSRFSAAATPLAAAGATVRPSRRRPIQRTSRVRPPVRARRTASSSNPFLNPRRRVSEPRIAHRKPSTLPEQVHR